MRLTNKLIENLIFKRFFIDGRFTQDSPVYPDVWLSYLRSDHDIFGHREDLILTPHRKSSASQLFIKLSLGLVTHPNPDPTAPLPDRALASSGDCVVAKLTLDELIRVALPLTRWWRENAPTDASQSTESKEWQWLMELVGAIYLDRTNDIVSGPDDKMRSEFRRHFALLFSNVISTLPEGDVPPLFSVSRNRAATLSLTDSVPTTKADAGRRLFSIDGSDITWAVFDTGIDARHLAFRKQDPASGRPVAQPFVEVRNRFINHTRVVATYDFTRFREVLASLSPGSQTNQADRRTRLEGISSTADNRVLLPVELDTFLAEVAEDLRRGRLLDWTVLGPLLRIPHTTESYVPPRHSHGTHVGGIIGGNMQAANGSDEVLGMCPGISLYDIRVLNDQGEGNEFNILAAFQFIAWMNTQNDEQVIHGINLSFSMNHEVASFACGQTPVCASCNKLVANGVCVVTAAGNLGQALFQQSEGRESMGFRVVNITDPGNAQDVITVGSAHRNRPHTYGVSYFSSKGPTGDGRVKPDLVAPGEKIVSSVIGDQATERMDGTSMAAPHVSGAAALLMARHRELIGNPLRVKQILCSTATDLGRERYFQGHGMLDVLRAIQSI